jgi:hypothetical protein
MEAEEQAAGPLGQQQDEPRGEPRVDPRNRRSHARYEVDEDSILLLVSHGLSLESHILDLSLEGCRLRTRGRYTAGTRTRVEVTFKVNGIAFRFLGVIQWTDGKHLVGIRFVEMISRRREQLDEVICEMEAAAAARAAIEAAESQAEEQKKNEAEEQAKNETEREMEELAGRVARELAEREAREWAEIQEMARRAKVARPADSLQLSGQEALKRDRRIQTRHEVDTTATIFLIKIGSKLSGRILDLSMSGCRIRSDERFPLGIYTRVETEFRLAGLPFRLGGVIQAVHDQRDVGIRFLDVSKRTREQVEQLIAEIAEIRSRPAVRGEGALGGQI